ncbi:HAD-IA family hydrolase [Nocardiopsis rhodophaea]|uniref:HAD-IA family hydrolase n=1 Tax=Nocardiopsis rhodophaea TaxID=280238 RepID=UPI0031E3CD17
MPDSASRDLMSTAEGVLFDLDGVLVDSSAVIDRVWYDWAARHGLLWREVRPLLPGRPAAETVRMLAPHLDAAEEGARLERLQSSDLEGVRPADGAVELTEALTHAGTPWAIVTSGSRPTATSRLRAVGIPIPKVLITADDVRRGKPDPEGYRTAAERLGLRPEACVVMEDAEVGVRAGHAVGARIIGIDGPGLGAAVSLVTRLLTSPRDLLPLARV